MFFKRTQNFKCALCQDDLKNRLVGNHVTIHQMDFEVYEKDNSLRIVPHAEQTNSLTTLPITKVDLKHEADGTKIIVTSQMRKLDSGGPLLLMMFCAFLLIASVVLLYVGQERQITYTLLGAGTLIFGVFWVRMQMGYFDYIRKIQNYVKSKSHMELA